MPVTEAREIGTERGIPRGDALVERHVDAADAALKLHGVPVVEADAEAVEIEHVEIAGADVPADVGFCLRRGEGQVEMLLKTVLHLGADAELVGAAAVVARVCGDDHLVGLAGDGVEESPDPLAGPAGGREGGQLGKLGCVVVDVAREEVATEPDHDAADVGQPAFVLEHDGQPLAELSDPLVGHVQAVVVEAVDRRRVDAFLDVPVGEQNHHGGRVPLRLAGPLACPVRGDAAEACHRVGTGPLGVYASERCLVFAAEPGRLGTEPG